MSFRLLPFVWTHAQVSGSALLVLLALTDYADDQGRRIFPSYQTIAKKTGLSRNYVRRLIQRLQKEGYLEKVSSGGFRGGRNFANEYRLSPAWLATGSLSSSPAVEPDAPALEPQPADPSQPDPPHMATAGVAHHEDESGDAGHGGAPMRAPGVPPSAQTVYSHLGPVPAEDDAGCPYTGTGGDSRSEVEGVPIRTPGTPPLEQTECSPIDSVPAQGDPGCPDRSTRDAHCGAGGLPSGGTPINH